MPLEESQVLDALRSVEDPDLHRDIVALGFVKDIEIQGDTVAFKVELTTPACPVKDLLKQQCEDAVLALEGVRAVEVEMTARVIERTPAGQDLIPGVKQCIAIASGKGGVGKSTVSVNIAVALAQDGARVGLLDADVYGPSIPLMLGCSHERPLTRDSKIVPINRFGVELMSLGFLLDEGQAVLWRGPMVAGTVRQLLEDVSWGELDYLIVDLPPGTGDAPMSLAQLVPLSGVAIVSTPHPVAANIAGKSAALFRRMGAPILGVIENMAHYQCPHCGESLQMFAGTSGAALADVLDCAFLGSIPLDPAIGESANRGEPAALSGPGSAQEEAFRQAARNLAAQCSIAAATRQETEDEMVEAVFEPAS